jgi:hypothetical protein
MSVPMIRNIGNCSPQSTASKPWPFYGGNILKSGSSLNRDFKEFLGLLIEESVEFALVGGFAVAYHGYPRFTGDLDILIARDADKRSPSFLWSTLNGTRKRPAGRRTCWTWKICPDSFHA